MIFGVTGASGFLGQAICREAAAKGDEIIPFGRNPAPEGRPYSLKSPLDLQGCEGIVHLAGESIMGLWTKEKRRRILESRIEGTRRLVEGIASVTPRPSVLVSASAIGFYGHTGEEAVDENSPAGSGFLAEVAWAWEEEAMKAESLGVRVVLLRIGFVLGRDGGAMPLIRPAFRLGLGGRLGSGRQWMSCIGVGDLAAIALDSLHDGTLSGPVNAVMPQPLTNADFTRAVARAAHRPAVIPAPALALRLLLGDLSHLLLDSQRVLPGVLMAKGYRYRHATPAAALAEVF